MRSLLSCLAIQVTGPVTTGQAAVSARRASRAPSVASPAPPAPTAGGAWAGAPVSMAGSVTTCPAPAGARGGGRALTAPSRVPRVGLVRAVSTSASVITEQPATRWTESASVSRASQETGRIILHSKQTNTDWFLLGQNVTFLLKIFLC